MTPTKTKQSNKRYFFSIFIFLSFGFTLITPKVLSSNKSAFCRDFAEEYTSWFASRYNYEWSKNYDYCLENANYLIRKYEYDSLPWGEKRRLNAEKRELKKKREKIKKLNKYRSTIGLPPLKMP
tara:strand:- start:67 stop:438 length:372 start_codon:yes stop_codon:yes gene_type:complete